MPSEPRQAKARELVFVNHQGVSQQRDELRPVSGTTSKQAPVNDDKVDMEIIILDPRRDKRSREKSKSASKSATQADETVSLDEATAAKTSEEQPVTSPALNERLLKRLEKQYGQKRIVQADDNTYVDYMDYF